MYRILLSDAEFKSLSKPESPDSIALALGILIGRAVQMDGMPVEDYQTPTTMPTISLGTTNTPDHAAS